MFSINKLDIEFSCPVHLSSWCTEVNKFKRTPVHCQWVVSWWKNQMFIDKSRYGLFKLFTKPTKVLMYFKFSLAESGGTETVQLLCLSGMEVIPNLIWDYLSSVKGIFLHSSRKKKTRSQGYWRKNYFAYGMLHLGSWYSRLHVLQQVPSTWTGSMSSEQFAGGQKILRHSTTPFWNKMVDFNKANIIKYPKISERKWIFLMMFTFKNSICLPLPLSQVTLCS